MPTSISSLTTSCRPPASDLSARGYPLASAATVMAVPIAMAKVAATPAQNIATASGSFAEAYANQKTSKLQVDNVKVHKVPVQEAGHDREGRRRQAKRNEEADR